MAAATPRGAHHLRRDRRRTRTGGPVATLDVGKGRQPGGGETDGAGAGGQNDTARRDAIGIDDPTLTAGPSRAAVAWVGAERVYSTYPFKLFLAVTVAAL